MGRALALSALALLPLAAAQGPDSGQDPPAAKPAPRPVAQLLQGFDLESALRYDADPDSPHVLRASFAGREHARWWIGAGIEGAETRLLRLRSEGHVYALELDSAKSIELEGAQRAEALAQFELRRALLDFEAFEWKTADSTRTAALGELGSLRARFAKPGDTRPSEITFLDPQGHVQDSCRAIQWDASGGHPRPAALEFWHAETRVWKETVKRVQPMSFTRDAFVPRDRLEGAVPAGGWKIVPTPSPEYAARRFALPEGASFESARKEIERLRSEWAPRLEPMGLALEDRGTLELDAELRPRFVVLRLSKVPEALPEGFEKVSGRSAVGTALGGFAQVQPAVLQALQAKLPPKAKPGAPYVRWLLEQGEVKQVLLLLSWTTEK